MAKAVVRQQTSKLAEILRAALMVGLIAGGVVGFVVLTQGRDSFHLTVALIIVAVATLAGSGLGALIGVISSAFFGESAGADK